MSKHIIENLLKDITAAKSKALQAIIDDESINKFDKLRLFEFNNLLGIGGYIQSPSKEIWGHEKPAGEGWWKPEELVFTTDERYTTVSFYYSILSIIENGWGWDDDKKPELPNDDSVKTQVRVLMWYRYKSNKLDRECTYTYKTVEEIIDAIYDYALKHKIWGFKNDW